jgi:CRP-like cAMP-binding protein
MTLTIAPIQSPLASEQFSNAQRSHSRSALTVRSPLFSKSFNRREFLPSLDQTSIWQIESGIVRTLTWDVNGNTIPLGFWGTGDEVGYSLAGVSPYQIECLTPVTAYRLPESYVCPPEMLLAHICQSQMLLRISHNGSMEKRLLDFLSWLSKRFGQKIECGWRLDLRLTHLDIAEALGTTRVTVTRLLGQLQQSGAIQWSRQEQILCNPAKSPIATSKKE